MKTRLLLIILLLAFSSRAQVIEKIVLGSDPDFLYKEDTNYFKLHYYKMVDPDSVDALLVLLPGYLRRAQDLFGRTRLARKAHDNKIGVVGPAINTRLILDLATWDMINKVVNHVTAEHNIPKDKVFLGGFSSGGHIALRYVQECIKTRNAIKPQGVFAVDPPVDLKRLYRTSKKMVNTARNKRSMLAGQSQVSMLEKDLRGDYKQYPLSYVQQSAYSRETKNGGNTTFLKAIPVRLYSEPDIDWYMKTFYMDYHDINAAELSGMINTLRILGNKKAELIISSGKGKRRDGKRHPHSWSILDAEDCLKWIQQIAQ